MFLWYPMILFFQHVAKALFSKNTSKINIDLLQVNNKNIISRVIFGYKRSQHG